MKSALFTAGLALLSGGVSASPIEARQRDRLNIPRGFSKLVFGDDFNTYAAGSQPNPAKWAFDLGTSYPGGPQQWGTNEVQTYTKSTDNIVITKSGTLLITPLLVNGKWTSSRIETTPAHDFACPAGKKIRIEANLRLGNNPSAQSMGIWPAFWMLGSAYRGNYWNWPTIGEVDVLESVNGVPTAWQTIHCGPNGNGGPCNEYSGIGNSVGGFTRNDWHTISVDIDRTNAGGSWQGEKLTWRLDGKEIFSVTGTRVNDEAAWTTVTRSAKFLLLNVAVGGSFPDNLANDAHVQTPTAQTIGGKGASMEVKYVAVFST
ncbi:concanavalin A-like lectin/glucanase domain-containing protein [Diplogelasinospora grovesii]|uniref:Concanavalin A-like lectin/glucanase domain-containing protein n=1 Tax=Diplogelasinospora grovesii TaxID=303347 RepID=A0AAN6N201_9PEZI|nr:concanavalin A-like lectin/glucanase domain-containing protein [Diplogelasinospora grovesii]